MVPAYYDVVMSTQGYQSLSGLGDVSCLSHFTTKHSQYLGRKMQYMGLCFITLSSYPGLFPIVEQNMQHFHVMTLLEPWRLVPV